MRSSTPFAALTIHRRTNCRDGIEAAIEGEHGWPRRDSERIKSVGCDRWTKRDALKEMRGKIKAAIYPRGGNTERTDLDATVSCPASSLSLLSSRLSLVALGQGTPRPPPSVR